MMAIFSNGIELEQVFFARPLTAWIWVVIIAAVIAGSMFLYRRERGIRLGMRITLTVVRILILLLVFAVLLEPTFAVKENREQRRSLAVLIDASESMSIRDQRKRPEDINEAATALGFLPIVTNASSLSEEHAELNTKQRNAIAAASRMDLARSLILKSAAPILTTLSEDLDISYYLFDDSVERLAAGNADVSAEISGIKPEGKGTTIADSIEAVANAYRDDALSGILLLSDGIETSTRQSESVAQDLGVRGITVYTVPTGIPDPDDISIRNVIVQDVAFSGDTVPVRIQIRSSGYEKRSTEMVVRFNEKEVARQEVLLEGGVQYVDVAFDANVRTKGAVVLSIDVSPFVDEATSANNRVKRSIRVVNEKINVLCIEGSARWEFRYLRAILKRDPRINATFIATRAGNDLAMQSSDYISRFPEDPEDAFKYDLVILGDVDSGFFTSGELTRLEELVRDRGGSLLMLAGPRYSPGSYENTSIEQMLPVRFDANDKWIDVGKRVYPVLTPEGRSSLVLTLEMDRDKNDRIWSHVSPMDHLPSLQEPRPGAMVLASLSDNGARLTPYPLISWQRYGTGKCMFMATDRLWRLRFRTGDTYHWRIWSQCIQFLTLSRLMGEHKQIRMETDRVSYPVGEQVRVYAEVLDDGYEPVLQAGYDVYAGVVNEDDGSSSGARVSLRPDSTRAGLYVGYFTPPGAGRYRIQSDDEDIDISNTIEFQVAGANPEMSKTGMQIDRMEIIAKLSGGTCLKFSEMPELVTSLDTSRYQTVLRREQPAWDNWFLVILIIGLAGFEWIIRRRCDLL